MLSVGLGSPARMTHRRTQSGGRRASVVSDTSHTQRDTTTILGTGRKSSGAQAFNVEYRGFINVNERFPQPGEMQPEHFTKLADGIEAAVLAQTKKQVKKAAKMWYKGKLTFDSANAVREHPRWPQRVRACVHGEPLQPS
jgi:hypothetical protein